MTQVSEFKPVTEQESLQSKIGNTVKIGKQVMKQQLQAELKKLDELREKTSIDVRVLHDIYRTYVNTFVKQEIHSRISRDSEVTRLRNIFRKYASGGDTKELYGDNIKFISHINSSPMHYLTGGYITVDEKMEKQRKGDEPVDIGVSVNVGDIDEDGDHCGNLCFEYSIYLNSEAINLLNDYLVKSNELSKLCDNCELLKDKLTNIDEVAEEMEAAMLVQELGKTEQGKQALQVASELVSSVLGKTPSLLVAPTQGESSDD